MAHKLETAHISFGLVTIPVGIYSAIEEQDIHFNQLHEPCGSRIKQLRFCPVCNRDVNYDELVKGYEIAKDEYVRISFFHTRTGAHKIICRPETCDRSLGEAF